MNNLLDDLGQAGHGKLEWSPSRWINNSPGRLWAFLGAAGLLLFLCGLGNHGLWGAEEPYVGGIIREMADSHNWVIPTLNGHPYLEKPPLYYVTGVLTTKLFSSFAPWVLRLPSALFALATMAWIAWLAARRGSPAAVWWAALCLGTSDLFFRIGHKALVDMSLVFAVSVGLGLAWLLFEEPERRVRWIPWLWVSLGLASLIIRKPMQSVKTLGQVEALMAQDRPVVVLAAPGTLPGGAGLENGLIVRPEMPLRGVQGTGLCLILNQKAALDLPGKVSICKADP